MELKKIKSRIWVNDYTISFEYDTKRHNHKTQERMITTTDEESAKRDFWIWMDIMKGEEPHRTMTNVNILAVVKGEGRYISL